MAAPAGPGGFWLAWALVVGVLLGIPLGIWALRCGYRRGSARFRDR